MGERVVADAYAYRRLKTDDAVVRLVDHLPNYRNLMTSYFAKEHARGLPSRPKRGELHRGGVTHSPGKA